MNLRCTLQSEINYAADYKGIDGPLGQDEKKFDNFQFKYRFEQIVANFIVLSLWPL